MIRIQLAAVALLSLACVSPGVNTSAPVAVPVAGREPGGRTVPYADYHTHLFTYSAISRVYPQMQLPQVALPADIQHLLAERRQAWNDRARLAILFSNDAVAFQERIGPEKWIHGKDSVSAYVASLFGREYFIAPIQFTGSDSVASIAGYIARPVPTGIRYFGYVLTTFRKEPDGRWRIASEMYKFPGPRGPDPETPEQLIALLDAAGIRKALVLSTAYWFGHGNGPAAPDEYERVRAENDSVSQQVARFPDRLVGFFSVNPLKDYAVQEIERCANDPHLKGMKLHFGDSEVNVLDPGHVAKVRRVFEAANSHHLPIVVHLMTADTAYGRAQSLAFLEKILPAAPDIPVQIAHLAGSGPQYNSDPAFAVFSEAAARHDPRMKNVYTDVATVVTLTTPPKALELIARRLREFGLSHVLYGSDTPASLDITPESGWLAFRRLPMSDREFKRIADNITPYMR